MSKIIQVVNGKEMSKEEAEEYFKKKPSLESILKSKEGRKGLANALRRDNSVYEHGASEACGMPRAQARAHHEWVKQQGLVGVEVLKDGRIRFAGPQNKKAYLAARGLADYSTAGSDTKVDVAPKKVDPPKRKKGRRNASSR